MCTTSFCHQVYHNKRKSKKKNNRHTTHHTEHTNSLHGIRLSTRNPNKKESMWLCRIVAAATVVVVNVVIVLQIGSRAQA